MVITARKHKDNFMGDGYYLVSETMDRIWYKGSTPEEAVDNFCKDRFDRGYNGVMEKMITIKEAR